MIDLKINPEYEALCTPLTTEEYESLKESIREEGLWMPLILNPEHEILDGHHRHRACNEVGRHWDDPNSIMKRFSSKLLEKKFVIETNLKRRQLSTLQKAEMALKLEPIEAELARQRQEAGKPTTLQSNDGKVVQRHKRTTLARVAKKVGLSPATYRRAKKVLEEAPEELIEWVKEGDLSITRAHRMINGPVTKKKTEEVLEKASKELKEKLRKGKITLTYAYQTLNRRQKHANPPPLPEGKFDVIYADPPWSYDLVATDGNPEPHYPLASQEEICNLEVEGVSILEKIADTAVLFLWATSPKIREALEVIEAWGFDYRTLMVWVKDRPRLGFNFRGQVELLLFAKKGNMPSPTTENRHSQVLNAPITKHSEKPTIVYEIIEKMYPNRRYMELFARKTRENWESWGDEVDK